MYKFGQIEIESKKFNSEYQVQKDVDCEKIRVSEGVVANKHDTRYTLGYEVEPRCGCATVYQNSKGLSIFGGFSL